MYVMYYIYTGLGAVKSISEEFVNSDPWQLTDFSDESTSKNKQNFLVLKKKRNWKPFKAFSDKAWKKERKKWQQFILEVIAGMGKLFLWCFSSFDNHTGDLQLPNSLEMAGF